MTARAAARILALLAVLAGCFVGHTLARATGRTLPWVRRFLRLAARTLGADVSIVGMPAPGPVLFVANHLSWLDILAMGGATGTAFVSKDAVARWPVVGGLARLGGTVFIARGNRGEARRQADTLRSALAARRPVTLFPEGTTGDGRTLLPFHATLFEAVADGSVVLQPIAVDYGDAATIVAWPPGERAIDAALRLIGRRGRIAVTLRFLPPIAIAGRDRKQLAAVAHAAIAGALAREPAGATARMPHRL